MPTQPVCVFVGGGGVEEGQGKESGTLRWGGQWHPRDFIMRGWKE